MTEFVAGERGFVNGKLRVALSGGPSGLRLSALGLSGKAGNVGTGPLVALVADGVRIDGADCSVAGFREETRADGATHVVARLRAPGDALELDAHLLLYPDAAVIETWLVARNVGRAPIRIERLDSLVLDLPAAGYELRYYTSDWGAEFEPMVEPLAAGKRLETRAGRSSKGEHPWFALVDPAGSCLVGAVAWSGNWLVRFDDHPAGSVRISGGLNDWEFFHDLEPGAEITAPPFVLALGTRADLNDATADLAAVGRRHWYPQNTLTRRAPIEWNHWWSYVDTFITEDVFRANVDEAIRLGMDVATLDAGWFGPSDPATHWYDYRGDWDQINTARFPSGIRALADYTHDKGLAFGIWCEIEALGQHAKLAETRPELVARRDGERLGYVCLGCPEGREWAFATLQRLIVEYGADWIKLDFNLDPGAGCNRTDHGHGAGDGLFAHYQGYYALLERVRAEYPEVVLESCSSGGLRIDLGLMRRTATTFLSDPDWPEHNLQLFWGASTMLAPEACLHWGFCEWTDTRHPKQTFNPRDPNLTPDQLDYFIRGGMLGAFGYSYALPILPEWVKERVAWHNAMYRDTVARFVRNGAVARLTPQPRREGLGDRWAGFQYTLPEGAEHLLFVFRLHGGESERAIVLQGLDPERVYTITRLTGGGVESRGGADLMSSGIVFTDLPEEGSEILLLT